MKVVDAKSKKKKRKSRKQRDKEQVDRKGGGSGGSDKKEERSKSLSVRYCHVVIGMTFFRVKYILWNAIFSHLSCVFVFIYIFYMHPHIL